MNSPQPSIRQRRFQQRPICREDESYLLEVDFPPRSTSSNTYFLAYARGIHPELMRIEGNQGFRIEKYWLEDQIYRSKKIGWRLIQFQQIWRRYRIWRRQIFKWLLSRQIGIKMPKPILY